MSDIKPIETFYDGHRFRSRLEARWAVFFNALGVKYEYEPEGFDLGDGYKYLPDFRVKCYGHRGGIFSDQEKNGLCWVCKHNTEYTSYPFEVGACSLNVPSYGRVSGNHGITRACCCFECVNLEPTDLYIEVKGRMSKDDAEKIRRFVGVGEHGYCNAERNSLLVVNTIPRAGESSDFELGNKDMDGTGIYPFNYQTIDGDWFGAYPAADSKGRFYLWGDDSDHICKEDIDRVERAYEAARCARFEHGEMPVVRRNG